MKNPMELYSKKVNKNFIDVLKDIINHDLFNNSEKSQRIYELFCEIHTDWKNQFFK